MTVTQRDRVLTALRHAGAQGIKRTDFLAPDVIDAGKPIINIPARVEELRKQGYRITTRPEASGLARYVLVADRVPPPGDGPPLVSLESLPLRDEPPAPASPYDPTSEWA